MLRIHGFRPRLPRNALAAVFGLVALCSLAGFANSTLWLFNLCAQFRLAYVVLFVVFAAIFVVRRDMRIALASLILTVINALPVIPYWSHADQSSVKPGAASLRVLQMNLWVENKNYDSVVNFIRREAPDVVAVEEYSQEAEQAFTKLGLWNDYPFHVSAKNNYLASQIALFSRVPPVNYQIVPTYQQIKDPSIFATMRVEDKQVSMVVMHPRPPAVPQLLTRQTNQLAKVASARAAMQHLVIVAGDLNTTAWTQPFQTFLRTMNVRDSRQGFGVAATYPTWLPFLPIDYVLCSPEITVRKFVRLSDSGSDHQCVLVDLEF